MKFLILKTSALGDILHAWPALNFLRQKFPHSKIDWVVERGCASLLTRHPDIDYVFPVDTRQWRKGKNLIGLKQFFREVRRREYDFVFDLQGNCKSAFLLALTRGKQKVGFGWKSAPEWPNCLFTSLKITPPKGENIRDDYLAVVSQALRLPAKGFKPHTPLLQLELEEEKKVTGLFESLPSQRKILVAPGSAWKNKQLSIEQLLSFLHKQEEAFFLFSWGGEDEKRLVEELHKEFPGTSRVLEHFSLPSLQHVMSRVDLVVAMDSLPLHLAGTTATPTHSFFGPTLPGKYLPLGPQHTFRQGRCPYQITFEKRCPNLRSCESGACIKNIEV